ncbi:MAG: hypothetical protein M3Y33_11160 [Actinomycetota bacterium]|nr:hypothetical protein [Actinomycetota bacterium]
MLAGSAGRRCAAIVRELEIPEPFDLGQFIATLVLRRQRLIFLQPFTSGRGDPCGLWIGTDEADYIFCEQGTTPWHKTHIVTHEIAHMLLDHSGGTAAWQNLARLLAPDVDPALARLILGRTAYSTQEEREAETLASLILGQGSSAARPAPVIGPWAATVICWRLHSLWAALSRAAPEVQLPSQPGRRFSIRYRLHRRVIEIRDAQLALRPFLRSGVAGQAADAAWSAGLAPGRRDAVIEAAVIVTALDACLRGDPAREHEAPAEPISPMPANDLGAEASRLILVSQAIRYSPIVRGFGTRQALSAAAVRWISDLPALHYAKGWG